MQMEHFQMSAFQFHCYAKYFHFYKLQFHCFEIVLIINWFKHSALIIFLLFSISTILVIAINFSFCEF